MNEPVKTGPRPSDKWIPWYFVLFFVVLVLTIVPMAYIAIHTMPGVVTSNAYEKGLAYNKAIAAGEQEKVLGWQGEVAMDAVDAQKAEATVSYILRDAQGASIDDAAVHAWIVRPAQGGMDRDVALTAVGSGKYSAPIALPARGVWDVRVSATRQDKNFQSEKRVVIQ